MVSKNFNKKNATGRRKGSEKTESALDSRESTPDLPLCNEGGVLADG